MITHETPDGVGFGPGPGVGAVAVALQLPELLTVVSALEVAVTVIVTLVPSLAPLGTVAVSDAVPDAPAARVIEVGVMLGDHPVPPETLRSKVSVALPVLLIVTV